MSTDRKPFTKRQRERVPQSHLGYRPVNNWGSGDLPAPFAYGDVLFLSEEAFALGHQEDRLRGQEPGHFLVTYICSIDDGDAWYARVWDGKGDFGSDRMHVAFEDRCTWDHDCNFMEGFELVDTADPDGLALRERMIADGWDFDLKWFTCPTCGHRELKDES